MASTDTRFVSTLPDAGGGYRITLASGNAELDVDLFPTCCDNPECDCRDVHITMEPSHSAAWAEPRSKVSVSVCVDTGELAYRTEGCTVQLRDSLKDKLTNTALLLNLRERRRRIKLQCDPDAWKKQDWSWWEPGVGISWRDASPGSFDDMILIGDKQYLARDTYCCRPGCQCDEALLVFYPTGRGDDEPIGDERIIVDVAKWKATNEQKEPLRKTQRVLWEAYSRLPDINEHLRQRKRKIVEIGRELHNQWSADHRPTQTVAFRKTGRNLPCPCGSGKKFKRCCGSA